MKVVESKTNPRPNNTYCSVPQCRSRQSKYPELSFHIFPSECKQLSRRKQWIDILKIAKPVTKYMLVCSRHFEKSDFILGHIPTKKPHLKLCALPSRNLPFSSITDIDERTYKKINFQTKKKPMKPAKRNSSKVEIPESVVDDDLYQTFEDPPSSINAANTLIELSRGKNNVDSRESTKNSPIKVSSTSQILSKCFRFEHLDKKSISALTGLPSIRLLDLLTEQVRKTECTSMKSEIKEQIIMTLMRIKLNLSFEMLSILFGVPQATVVNIFGEIIAILAQILDSCIQWVSKEEVTKNMPKSFSDYKEVRVVLGSVELLVEKPKCLNCKVGSFSRFFGGHSVKFIFGSTPAGLVTFRSKCYGGQVSNSEILTQSGLILMLEPRIDSVLMDKKFIEKEIQDENEIIDPDSSENGGNSTSQTQRGLASTLVEKIDRRFKTFKLLRGTVPWALASQVDDIMTVIIAIFNLGDPDYS